MIFFIFSSKTQRIKKRLKPPNKKYCLHKQQNITCLWAPEELGQLAESGLQYKTVDLYSKYKKQILLVI